MCRTGEAPCDPNRPFVDEDLVVGRVFAVIWPRDHMDWLHRPDTFADVPDAL
jgi:signal peptidase I